MRLAAAEVPARNAAEMVIAGAPLLADPAGALYWPDEGLLAVADLHLEKGSSFAQRGALLPPYDTSDTLARLTALMARYAPRVVVALGDSFHDRRAADRLARQHRDALGTLQRGRDWIWIAGNHDPEPNRGVGGNFLESFASGPLIFRHQAKSAGAGCEISGHLHPVAVVAINGRGVRRRCFVGDGRRLVMPAFGAYAGGLNVRHRAFAGLLHPAFTAHVLGDSRVFAIAARHCVPDWLG